MELGSEYHLDLHSLQLTDDTIFNYLSNFDVIFTDSGRNALKLLLSHINCTEIFLPNYICDSVIQSIPSNIVIHYYSVDVHFQPDFSILNDSPLSHTSIIYIMNYFGHYLSGEYQEYLRTIKQKYKCIIIEDTTHSLLSSNKALGDYCVCSLRKWFPIPDGGVLYSPTSLNFLPKEELIPKPLSNKLTAMLLKSLHLQGTLDCNSVYRSIFATEESCLDLQDTIYSISLFSLDLLRYFSISNLQSKRITNGTFVHTYISKNLPNHLVFSQLAPVPFSIPIYCSQRDSLRRFLMDAQIYCAVHWPLDDTPLKCNKTSMYISQKILSLPIDHRYSKEHMTYLINTLTAFYSK